MKKGHFKIVRPDGVFEVEGLVDQLFGICRWDYGADRWFAVTHRPTGKLMASFSKRKHAEAFVSHMPSAPHPWLSEAEAQQNAAYIGQQARAARSGLLEKLEQEKPAGLFG